MDIFKTFLKFNKLMLQGHPKIPPPVSKGGRTVELYGLFILPPHERGWMDLFVFNFYINGRKQSNLASIHHGLHHSTSPKTVKFDLHIQKN